MKMIARACLLVCLGLFLSLPSLAAYTLRLNNDTGEALQLRCDNGYVAELDATPGAFLDVVAADVADTTMCHMAGYGAQKLNRFGFMLSLTDSVDASATQIAEIQFSAIKNIVVGDSINYQSGDVVDVSSTDQFELFIDD